MIESLFAGANYAYEVTHKGTAVHGDYNCVILKWLLERELPAAGVPLPSAGSTAFLELVGIFLLAL